ncbi:hypothetical protein F9K94_22115 [Brucella tritici]|uniref:Uncharacterized protein n=1 Tax=Brucella tritici TaxID=94626 RepID=A0A7V7VQN8_9HYPH|nr:hypothetical protein [Brucella tritici]KAB2654961.1 hypothetical protein F9K94_22115 [Brucella tritici]
MSELTVVDYATLWTAFLATVGSIAGVWVYFRKGPVLVVKIIPPTRNRKNKSSSDRIITIEITNKGEIPATISRIDVQTTVRKAFFRRGVLQEAIFDDSTPWRPDYFLEPAASKVYDLKFFNDWDPDTQRIDVFVYLRGRNAPISTHARG